MGPFRASDSERRERKPSDRKESRVRSRPFPNQTSDRERLKGQGRGTGVRACGF